MLVHSTESDSEPEVPQTVSSKQKEERQRKSVQRRAEKHRRSQLLQLYVFASRCVAYPILADYPSEVVHRKMKVTEAQLRKVRKNFETFIDGQMNIEVDEAFRDAVEAYYQVFLDSDQLAELVDRGAVTLKDFREIFRKNIERRAARLPDIDGIGNQAIISCWMHNFDEIVKGCKKEMDFIIITSEAIPTADELYKMLQRILDVKKYEHQCLYNSLQVG